MPPLSPLSVVVFPKEKNGKCLKYWNLLVFIFSHLIHALTLSSSFPFGNKLISFPKKAWTQKITLAPSCCVDWSLRNENLKGGTQTPKNHYNFSLDHVVYIDFKKWKLKKSNNKKKDSTKEWFLKKNKLNCLAF